MSHFVLFVIGLVSGWLLTLAAVQSHIYASTKNLDEAARLLAEAKRHREVANSLRQDSIRDIEVAEAHREESARVLKNAAQIVATVEHILPKKQPKE